jgi:hypothetical protein
LVSDQDLIDLADPDTAIDLSLTYERRVESLRQVCERAQAQGQRTLIVAYDHFFGKYRPGLHAPRRLTPDTQEYIERIAALSRFAAGYGLALELSLLSPLEIGPAFRRRTGEGGLWLQGRKGRRNPGDGAFSVEYWLQQAWVNNKGVTELEDAGVRAFAFRERPIPGTPYLVVEPDSIREISITGVERRPGQSAESSAGTADAGNTYRAERVRVHGTGSTEVGPLDRVLVVQAYRSLELDYFSPDAAPFLHSLLDRYVGAGVRLNALYSDELHIQQDWGYFHHHDHGEFTPRYVSPGLARRFAEHYGEQYLDFAPYLLYFVSGQEDAAHDLSAKRDLAHVFGDTPEAIARTALFRSRYYHLLQNGVVDLFLGAKRHLETRLGYRLEARAHATWAESPTIDAWEHGQENQFSRQYEYTSQFVWSNTVHQAAAACYDYFKWGEFLTGGGNDHAECGWLDRNYLGLALACSTGIVNDVPYSYAFHWGMPEVISRRRFDLMNAYGVSGEPWFGMVQEMQHRDVDVLMLYPLDLVAVDQRFGSWTHQYGYANLVSQAKLLERGTVHDGAILLGGRRFTTLVATFEPFLDPGLLEMLAALAQSGGRVVWSGPPPLLTASGAAIPEAWGSLFACRAEPAQELGKMAAGMQVVFDGALAEVASQTILTHLVPDRVYPVTALSEGEVVARVKGQIVGVLRRFPGGGSATFLGFRPRDDQSGSLGYDQRTFFEILHALGAYPGSGVFDQINDNTEYLSRTGPYLACRFPNGTVTVAPHLREVEECWPGGFARDATEDEAALAAVTLPSRTVALHDARINGWRIDYEGLGAMAFRVNAQGDLIAFAGSGAGWIGIDDRRTVFAEGLDLDVAWAPVSDACRIPAGALLQIRVRGEGAIRIPVPDLPGTLILVAEGPHPGSRGEQIVCSSEEGILAFTATPAVSGRRLYALKA